MNSDQFILYAGGAIVAIFIYYFLIQWIFEIKKRNRYMEAQLKLLVKIAQKQGVPSDEIDGIIKMAEKCKNNTPFNKYYFKYNDVPEGGIEPPLSCEN